MNKSKFLELIKNPELIKDNDLTKLTELQSEYPYSQIIHLLNVKGRKILGKQDFEKALNLAAVYSYDRTVLHSIVEGISVEVAQPSEEAVQPSNESEEEESVIEETSDFEWINEDLVDNEPSVPTNVEAKPVESDPKDTTADNESTVDKESADEEPAVPGTEPIEDPLNLEIENSGIHAELMKNLNQLQENRQQYEGQPKEDEDSKSGSGQIEIIDNFIKNSPVLSKPNLTVESEAVTQKDLSKDSGKFSEELASENLAKILLKQGKRKDAEKIYKKLINKFPQKKAYFADQIQKLKKK